MAAAIQEAGVAADDLQSQVKPFAETLKCAAYAAQGGRKTLQIGHLIETFGVENVAIISCEHGLGTISSRIDERYVFRAGDRQALREAYMWVQDNGFTNHDKWVCVDGGSRALNWINHEIFAGAQKALEGVIEGKAKQALDPAYRKYASYINSDQSLNSQQMWWRTGYECEQLLDAFIKLGSNMYWTFWEDQTSISQYVKGVPWIPETPGKGALTAVKGAFDFIFRLTPSRIRDEATGELRDSVAATFRNPPGNNENYAKVRDDWDGGVRVPDRIDDFNLADFAKLITKTSARKAADIQA
jgi:hypothetical protein